MERNAKWIKAKQNLGSLSPEFRKEYVAKGTIKKATATVTAMGVYNLYVNGAKAGNAVLAPFWTSYPHRVQEQTYDVTDLMGETTTFGILLGKGWAMGRVGYSRAKYVSGFFAENACVIGSIRVEYTDGTVDRINTDDTWQVWSSQILDSEMYDGETVDHTAEIKPLGTAVIDENERPEIIPQQGELVTEHERIFPCEIIKTPKGETVLDFGQNLAGYVEIRIRGKRGDRIVLTHAEVLDRDGNFYTENLRSAANRNIYTLSGEGEEVFKPTFCFQGFRYVRLDEFPADVEVRPENFTAIVIYSDMKRTGDFSCGNSKINQLYSNIIWGQRGNFIDIPTDCPQRDERLGWTGDAEVFCRTAAINYDVENFFRKWLTDMALEQTPEGGVWGIVPGVGRCGGRIATGWADAAVICPWEIYRAYGDKELLRQNYSMMKKWIGYMHAFGEDEFLFVGGFHYGDWLAMDAGYGVYEGATQTDLIASAFFAYSTELVIRAGRILGEDVSEFEELYQNVRNAFRAAFMKDGLPTIYPKADAFATNRPVKGLTQTSIVLVLRFGLYEESERQGLIDKLAELIAENDGRMTTGFLGTPHILHVLSQNGRIDLAYDLLLQEKAPSWLFSVNHGATTIWEHWDSQKEDGTFWSTDMNSFNHYAYGAVYDWIFGVALGIDIPDDGAGYQKITVSPLPDRRLGFAKGSVETRHGKVASHWFYLPDGRVRYEITVPAGVEATINIAGIPQQTVSGGTFVYIA